MNEMSGRVLPPPDEPDAPARNRHLRAGLFGVLDIGTTKIACLIGRSESDGTLRVLGFGWHGFGKNSVYPLQIGSPLVPRKPVRRPEEGRAASLHAFGQPGEANQLHWGRKWEHSGQESLSHK